MGVAAVEGEKLGTIEGETDFDCIVGSVDDISEVIIVIEGEGEGEGFTGIILMGVNEVGGGNFSIGSAIWESSVISADVQLLDNADPTRPVDERRFSFNSCWSGFDWIVEVILLIEFDRWWPFWPDKLFNILLEKERICPKGDFFLYLDDFEDIEIVSAEFFLGDKKLDLSKEIAFSVAESNAFLDFWFEFQPFKS